MRAVPAQRISKPAAPLEKPSAIAALSLSLFLAPSLLAAEHLLVQTPRMNLRDIGVIRLVDEADATPADGAEDAASATDGAGAGALAGAGTHRGREAFICRLRGEAGRDVGGWEGNELGDQGACELAAARALAGGVLHEKCQCQRSAPAGTVDVN